jgi:hypothetical protein
MQERQVGGLPKKGVFHPPGLSVFLALAWYQLPRERIQLAS